MDCSLLDHDRQKLRTALAAANEQFEAEASQHTLDVEVHPAANLFPPMTEEEYQALKADIKLNGQRDRIAYYNGQVLDGRHRKRACDELGIEPLVLELDDSTDPVAFVLSVNLHRRHLTPSQRAMVGAKARQLFDRQAKGRMLAGKKQDPVENLPQGKARDLAGAAVGVSGKSIEHACHVLRQGTAELQAAVDSGNLSVSQAAELACLPPREQKKALKGGKAAISKVLAERKAKLKELLALRTDRTAGPLTVTPTAGPLTVTPAGGPLRIIGRPEPSAPPQCPNCGGVEFDDEGDCVSCLEPARDSDGKLLVEPKPKGVGVIRANEAIDCLKRIPKNDRLRRRAWQIIRDFLDANE